ncbi:hypothetical protein BH10PSE7_BH10PSE7_00610 [soil metagenome]
MKFRPVRWLVWAPLAGLPFLAAWQLNSVTLERRLSDAALSALSGAAPWAKTGVDGRDASLSGEAPDQEGRARAVALVGGLWGVRRLDSSAITVVVKLPEPSIATAGLVTNAARPELRGAWPEPLAKTLALSVDPGRTYTLGKDPELASDGKGNWTWNPKENLTDGRYGFTVEISDGVTVGSRKSVTGTLIIDTVPPAAPEFLPVKTTEPPDRITGRWPEGDASDLRVTMDGMRYGLKSGSPLSSSSGIWSLRLERKLAVGIHDLLVEAIDRAGNVAALKLPAAITIAEPPLPKPPAVAKYGGADNTPVITGTYDRAATKTLTVAIGGHVYELGKDAALSSDGTGTWSLAIAKPLKDGVYDVVATANGKVKDETVAEVEIDTTPPPAPQVNAATALPVTGTFAPRETAVLSVTLAGKTYTLGKGGGFSSEGENWSLAPLEAVPPGTYDVMVEAVDKFGNQSADESKDELVIAPPPPEPVMTEPTVDSADTLVSRPIITGTWSEGIAATLRVTLGADAFELGKDGALQSAAGVWKLSVPAPLRDGAYKVTAETRDKSGATLTGHGRIVVDAMGPMAPTVNLYAGETSPPAISGTWAEGDATTLSVTIAGQTAVLGTQAQLTSDKGTWRLTLSEPLAAGSHDVVVKTADKRGRIATDQTRFEILIKEKAKPQPPPEPPKPTQPPPEPPKPTQPPPEPPKPTQPPPVDCAVEIPRLLETRPIMFGLDRESLDAPASETVAKLAKLAAACAGNRWEVAGHTDSEGSRAYNQALSEGRAMAVMKALIAGGIARDQLSAVGYGESRPIADNATPEGRARNRRIEITPRVK